MKCKVCGGESGKYPLCRVCNIKKERGEIVKCTQCGNWHYAGIPCPTVDSSSHSEYLYEVKNSLMSQSEQGFYDAIKNSLPDGFLLFPQINLASFIERTDDARFHNELFRNIDFLITNDQYQPKIVIEINDQTHLTPERRERDEKVRKICEEAGIPLVVLWTSYGINPEYIKNKISQVLTAPPVERIHHFDQQPNSAPEVSHSSQPTVAKKGGCYIATCVYGSYDCPPVWVLRRYRDVKLSATRFGRASIRLYYLISPTLVKLFGNRHWFKAFFRHRLDKFVAKLSLDGFESTPYAD